MGVLGKIVYVEDLILNTSVVEHIQKLRARVITLSSHIVSRQPDYSIYLLKWTLVPLVHQEEGELPHSHIIIFKGLEIILS